METNCESESDPDRAGSRMRCCCGQPRCAYLEHNNTALGGLERDLETAARLGQALLSRHESYISESQAEHARMSAYISELESERLSLQSANEKIVAENRSLLSQLEALNTTLASSDEEVHRLETLLLDCELELKRLNGFVRKAEELDGRMQEMERERQSLTRKLHEGKDESRGMLARWRESERKVRELEEDVRRMEREATQEREKHEDIMNRIEKERQLERELGSAEGRLKGAAAIQSIKNGTSGSKTVVSHFVRDILHDNANLQAGIAELRQLLQSSNEEVQNLREQIMLHQPVEEEPSGVERRRTVSLGDELANLEPTPQQVQREVHVHHHYHAKLAKKDRAPTVRRASKKRAIMPPQSFTGDVSGTSTPMSFYQPQPRRTNRWSVQSTATQSTALSSIPSSPRSYFDRGGYLFDRMEAGEESSRPTSPESVADFYPLSWKESQKAEEPGLGVFEEEDPLEEETISPLAQQATEDSKAPPKLEEHSTLGTDPGTEQTEQVEQAEQTEQTERTERELTPKPSILLHSSTEDFDQSQIPEPALADDSVLEDGDDSNQHTPTTAQQSALDNIPEIRPTLTRQGSHESLVSISGMDIHIAKRPALTAPLELLRGNSAHFALSPAQTRKISASRPLASVTEYTVLSPAFESSPAADRSVRRVPSSIEALSGIAVPPPRGSRSPQAGGGISRLVGGWVRGKWGMAPAKSVGDLRDVSSSRRSETSSLAPSTSSTSESIRSSAKDYPDLSHTKPTSFSSSPPKPIPATRQQHGFNAQNRSKSSTQTESSTYDESATEPHPKIRSIVSDSFVKPSILFAGRSPGVNQPGFMAGFRQTQNPVEIVPKSVDEDGLKDGLRE